MRAAPPVQMTCGHDGLWQVLEQGLAAAAAATAVAWMALHAGQPALSAGLAAAVGAAWALVAAAQAAPPACHRRLQWDGQTWTLDGATGRVSLMLDVGPWLLLRFDADQAAGAPWLPLRLSACGAAAHLVRAALFAHAGARRPGLAGSRSLQPNG